MIEDYIDEFIEDETDFDNEDSSYVQIHSEVYNQDIDDIDWEPHKSEDEETEDIYGYYD